jgi:hypothetical protein
MGRLSSFCLGILGKLALWNTLEAVGKSADDELKRMKMRAAEQHAALETLRMNLAARLFHEWDTDAKYLHHERRLIDWGKQHGIEIGQKHFSAGKAGEFDGTTILMNPSYEPRERLYYAAHAIGSIVIWSRNPKMVQSIFDELRELKLRKSNEAERFVMAIERYRQFEAESSEHGVWILQEIGASSEVSDYTNLMRADLEAMTQFHEVGQAPVWNEFFMRWNREVGTGERTVEPFEAKLVENFHAIKIEPQEILQRQ